MKERSHEFSIGDRESFDRRRATLAGESIPTFPHHTGQIRHVTGAPALLGPAAIAPGDLQYPPLLRARGTIAIVSVIGNPDLLRRQAVGLLCSRRCPGSIILRMYDFAQKLKLHDCVIAGGFQSPMERQCFEILAGGRSSVILCPAKNIDRMHPRGLTGSLLRAGRLVVLSPFHGNVRRCTRALAAARNRFVGSLAAAVIIPHAARGSDTERITRELLEHAIPVFTFDDPANASILALGAQRLEHSTLSPGFLRCTS